MKVTKRLCRTCGLPITPRRDEGPQHFSKRVYCDRACRAKCPPNAVLTFAAAGAIKRALKRGEKVSELAKRYGVSRTTVSHIGTGFRWKGA
jgi:hypothetical protein